MRRATSGVVNFYNAGVVNRSRRIGSCPKFHNLKEELGSFFRSEQVRLVYVITQLAFTATKRFRPERLQTTSGNAAFVQKLIILYHRCHVTCISIDENDQKNGVFSI
jgi:hypothetical protein